MHTERSLEPRAVRASRGFRGGSIGLFLVIGTIGAVAVGPVMPAVAGTSSTTLTVAPTSDFGPAPTSATEVQSNVSVPVTTATDATVELTTSWSPAAATMKPGSVVAPHGWPVEYYDGSTWTSVEPGDPSSVESVRAQGVLPSTGDGGNGNTLLSDSLDATLSGALGDFAPSGSGDGYDVAFPDADRVINAFHHNGPSAGTTVTVDCHLRSTGGSCPEGSITFAGAYRNPNNARIGANPETHRAYSPAYRESDGALGVLCADYSLATPAPCSPEFIPVSTESVMTSRSDIGGVAYGGNRFFLVNGANHRLYCLDMTTDAVCTGFGDHGGGADGVQLPNNSVEGPFGSGGWGWTSDLSVIEGKVYFFQGNRGGGNNAIGCVDPTTADFCGSNAPITFGTSGVYDYFDLPPVPIYNPAGTQLVAVCALLHFFCITPDGSATYTMPADMVSFFTPNGSGNPGIDYYGGYAVFLSVGEWAVKANRLFVPVEAGGSNIGSTWGSDLACWDFTTEAACAFGDEPGYMYDVTPGLSLYSATADPVLDCIWTNSDSGVIRAYSSGGGTCGDTKVTASFAFDEDHARLTCDGSVDVIEWKQLVLTLPDSLDPADLSLTVLDSADQPIDGWDGVAVTSTTIDVSSLLLSGTGTSPTFVVTVDGGTVPVVSTITAHLEFVAKAPQLCVTLIPVAVCTTGQTIDGRLPIPRFNVKGTSSITADAPAVTGSVTERVTSATYDAATTCGEGTVSGTAVEVGSVVPIAGATVRIRDRVSGRALATTITDSVGAYQFGHLTPGDYTVEFLDRGAWVVTPETATNDVTVVEDTNATVDGQYTDTLPATGGGNPWRMLVAGLLLVGVGLLMSDRRRRATV